MRKTAYTKQEVLGMLRRFESESVVEKAERELPEEIDLVQDQELLARFGLSRGQLMDRAGSSP